MSSKFTSRLGQESEDLAHVSNDIFNGNLDYPLRLPEFPYTAASLFDARFDTVTYGLTYVSDVTIVAHEFLWV